MDKINFVNGGQPAINDTNLNQLQTNIENAINGTVLYESEAGTTGNVELNETVENYRYLEIFFHNEGVAPGYAYNSVKVYNPNGKIVTLTIFQKDTTQNVIFMRTKNIEINPNMLKVNGYSNWNTFDNIEETVKNTIYIDRVIGYK